MGIIYKTTPHYLPLLMYYFIHTGRNRAKVFVRQEGAGTPVILLHGLGTSSLLYRDVIPLLSGYGVRGIAFDFPGCGLSEKSSSITYNNEYLANSINQVLESLQIPNAHFVVHDISGPILVEFGKTFSHKIKSVTFLNSYLDLENSKDFLSLHNFYSIPYVGDVTFLLTSSPYLTPLAWAVYTFGQSSSLSLDEVKSYSYLLAHLDGGASFKQIAKNFNISPSQNALVKQSLSSLSSTVPMQIVWGKGDGNSNQASYLAKNAKMKFISYLDCKYLVQEEAPFDVAQRVFIFIKEVDPELEKAHKSDREHGHAQTPDHSSHDHSHGHDHSHHGHDHSHGNFHDHDYGMGNHMHAHSHGHDHSHGHADHTHAHDHAHTHSHSHHDHTHNSEPKEKTPKAKKETKEKATETKTETKEKQPKAPKHTHDHGHDHSHDHHGHSHDHHGHKH
eukprot:TRINITY_DN3531_c0_g1_i1.p1 TRINITY_DN3531_c0_g1~~TRINITY_DN3531_c0_g1_i1.p1  ORF type:complete len:446 (-),score=71.16 TRINITY_DN3531_c0_g1_i1:52-1389(-)